MADMKALNDAVDALVAEEGSVKAALDDLSAKVAAGSGVTQADIDAVTAKLSSVSDDMKAAVDKDDPAPVDNTPAPIDSGAPVAGVPADDNTEQDGGVVTDEPTVGTMQSGDDANASA